MSLLATLRADQLAARKDRKEIDTGLLTALIGEAVMVGKNDGDRESTDDEVQATIRKFLKNAGELRTLVVQRGAVEGDADLKKVDREIAILNGYLPKQASDDEMRGVIVAFKAANPDAKIGQFMGHLKKTFGTNYDGRRASVLVNEALA